MSKVIPAPPPLDLLQLNQDKHWLNSSPTKELRNYEDETKDAINQWIELENFTGNIIVTVWQTTPKTIIQQGPQCGLVALSMAAESLGLSVDIELLFNKAKQMGITKQGEMFRATDLCKLANCFNIHSVSSEGILNNSEVILDLLNCGKVLLIPYDSDANHQPCLKKGHKAHWAVVYGFIVLTNEIKDAKYENLENLGQNCYRIKDINLIQNGVCKQVPRERICLIAKQGKSRRVGIWSFNELAASNANLSEVDPKRNSPLDYILPLDNKLTDLQGKVIIAG